MGDARDLPGRMDGAQCTAAAGRDVVLLGDGDGHHSSPAGVGQGWWCRYLSSSKSKGLGVSFDSCSQPSRPTLPSPIPSREHAALRWWGS